VILVITEVLRVFFYSLEEGLIVVDGLVDTFLVLVEVVLVDELEVVQVAVDAFVRLLVLQLDVVEQLLV
jgi:hypothetical protein